MIESLRNMEIVEHLGRHTTLYIKYEICYDSKTFSLFACHIKVAPVISIMLLIFNSSGGFYCHKFLQVKARAKTGRHKTDALRSTDSTLFGCSNILQ